MKWANVNKADLVPAAEANIRCPDIVIDFYEKHVVYKFSEFYKMERFPLENVSNNIKKIIKNNAFFLFLERVQCYGKQ